MTKRAKKPLQSEFDFPEHGGARAGAGRKRSSPRPTVPHVVRVEFASGYPIHVTFRVHEGLPSLREGRAHQVVLEAIIAGADRGDFRILEYSAQSNHVHLLCEADGREALSRGVQALKGRIARRLNRLWRRTGSLYPERYHDRVLKSPREVRNVLAYILRNSNHHGIQHSDGMDPCSSARWFHGERPSPFPPARTWLASVGWRRCGWIEAA